MQFYEAGYESLNNIQNMGSSFLYLIFSFGLLILLGILKLASLILTR
jgi:hypothetical protein